MAKLNKTYNILIRLGILVLTLYFLYDQLFYKHNLLVLWENFRTLAGQRNFQILTLLVLLLIPVNLLLESYKWKLLIAKLEQVSLWNALKAVLAGISVSMFMPNRVGDYLGRVFILKNANRIQATLITMLGSMAQYITTLLFGIVALLIFIRKWLIQYHLMNGLAYSGVILTALFAITVMVFAYLNFSAFSIIIKRISGRVYYRIERYVDIFAWYKSPLLLNVLFISIFRYFVFSFQFFILFRMFGIKISYVEAMIIISTIYLIMSIIPTIALSELGVRGSVSLYVFGLYYGGTKLSDYVMEQVVAASSVLWFINLAIPALLGVIFIFKLKFFRNNYDS
ncbi:MAG: flippase-like domain-containing protein [Bacteroidales bacterium]|nr:flippase-like domain-containing protein [Bacteroidales bacterium]